MHRRSFEAVLGPKRDYWLAATVALLLVGNGAVQISAPSTPDGVACARHVGVATAVALASVDLINQEAGANPIGTQRAPEIWINIWY